METPDSGLTFPADAALRTAISPPRQPVTTRGLSVVLPAYNEAPVIEETVRTCVAVLSELAPDFEVIIVDDGSGDGTGEIADRLSAEDPRIRVVHNRPNRGYGGALRSGVDAVSKDLTFFMDSDGQFDIRDIAAFLKLREERGHRAVLGYRNRRRDPFNRLVNAWGWKLLVSLMFGLNVRDIDCAFKLIDTELVHQCDVQSEGAVFSTELLVKLSQLGIRFVEVPVHHYRRRHGSATGASPRVILRAFNELFRARRTLRTWTVEQALHTVPHASHKSGGFIGH